MNYNLYPNVNPNMSPNTNPKRTGQKVTLIVVLAVVGVVALLIGWVLFVDNYGTSIERNLNEYISGDYINRPDGEIAAEYLPKYEELTDYKWVEYYYYDNSFARKLLGAYGDSFIVDVKYEASVYEEKKKEAFRQYFNYDDAAYREAVRYDLKATSNVHFVTDTLESPIRYFPYGEVNNGFYIEYHDSICVIRYCFVHRIGYRNCTYLYNEYQYFDEE